MLSDPIAVDSPGMVAGPHRVPIHVVVPLGERKVVLLVSVKAAQLVHPDLLLVVREHFSFLESVRLLQAELDVAFFMLIFCSTVG